MMAYERRITLHAGHNKPGKVACGASDYIDESKEARIIRKKIKIELNKRKITAYNCTINNGKSQNDILQRIVQKCNAKDRKWDFAIHFNASVHSPADKKSKGIEVLIFNDTPEKRKVAEDICKRVSKATGLMNRGVKVRSDLYFLRKANRPAFLIEICFVDDQDDVRIYKANKDLIAKNIAAAIDANY